MVALAVIAARVGWRVRLPCASSPVPSRAKTTAIKALKTAAIGLTRAGATSTNPIKNKNAPRAVKPVLRDNNPNTARATNIAPIIVLARAMCPPLSATDGRKASNGVTLLALKAGNSPASSVTPIPSANVMITKPG